MTHHSDTLTTERPDLERRSLSAFANGGLDPEAIRHALLLALVSWLLVASAYSGAVSPASGITGLDFDVFYQAASRLNAGQLLYQPHLSPSLHMGPYAYSPLLALMLRPLARLPFQTAMQAWFFVNASFLILAVLLYGAAARLTWRATPLLVALLLVSFRFWDTTMNFGLGQSNPVLLALIGAMLWADSRKRWRLLGLLIALAALFKIWLVGLLLYLLLRRRWGETLFSVGAFVAALGVLFTAVGWSEFPNYLSCMEQARTLVEGHTVMNSILGFAHLHLRANLVIPPLVDTRIGYAAFLILCTACVLWGFSVLWRILRDPSPLEARLSFGLILASLLLLLPTYENGYFIYCFPLLWTLLASPDVDGGRLLGVSSFGVSRIMLAGGILVYLIFSRSWPIYAPFPPVYQHGLRSLIVSMTFYGTVALWGIGFYCLHRLRSAKRPCAVSPLSTFPLAAVMPSASRPL